MLSLSKVSARSLPSDRNVSAPKRADTLTYINVHVYINVYSKYTLSTRSLQSARKLTGACGLTQQSARANCSERSRPSMVSFAIGVFGCEAGFMGVGGAPMGVPPAQLG